MAEFCPGVQINEIVGMILRSNADDSSAELFTRHSLMHCFAVALSLAVPGYVGDS